jgi:hypothetical protein
VEGRSHAQPARRESRHVAHDDWLFVHSGRDFAHGSRGLGAGLLSDDDLNQAHDVHRIEKVHADNILFLLDESGGIPDADCVLGSVNIP